MIEEKKVIVHQSVDLDTCVCITLAGATAREDVHFLPAGAMEIPKICPCCQRQLTGAERVLDHPLGEKGKLDADGTVHSAAVSMPEARGADPKLLEEVEEHDSTGLTKTPRFSLSHILAAIRIEAEKQGLRGTELDREVVAVMSRIIRGINLLYKSRQTARNYISSGGVSSIAKINECKFAVIIGRAPSQLDIVLNEEYGVTGKIYHNNYNLGVRIYPGQESQGLDLRILRPYLPGWFVHTKGFLACWGNPKSPEKSPPPIGTPQSAEELLALVKKIFEE